MAPPQSAHILVLQPFVGSRGHSGGKETEERSVEDLESFSVGELSPFHK